jgi:hypothetical protein
MNVRTEPTSLTEPAGPAGSRGGAGSWGLWFVVAGLMLAVYAATAQRGPAWQDSGIFQWRILDFDLTGKFGLALAHPLLIILGKAMSWLPFGPPAFRMNLVSALCGAVSAANVALLVRRLSPDRPAAAWVAAGLLGLAHTPWWLSTICESQMVFAALFTTSLHVLVGLVRRPTAGLALILGAVNGLGLLAHDLALLALAVYGLTVIALVAAGRLRWYAVVVLAAGWVAGSSGMLVLVARQAAETGLIPAVKSALFGRSWQGYVLGGSPGAVKAGVGYILYNFPNLGLVLAGVGLWALRKGPLRRLRWCFCGLTAIYLAFAVRYTVMDQFMFFVPFYVMVAVLAGVGLGSLRAGAYSWAAPVALASLLATPALYAAMPAVVRSAGLAVPGRKDLPFRDPSRYWLAPWKSGEDSAGLFARQALADVPAGGTIIADGTSLYPLLWTRRVDGLGRDVRLLEGADPRQVPPGTPNVFAVSATRDYYPPWLAESAFLEKAPGQVLYSVVWKAGMVRPAPDKPKSDGPGHPPAGPSQ